MNVVGAALFAVIPCSRNAQLVRALVAFQVALDYLDTVTERPGTDAQPHGMALHHALVEAVNPGTPTSDYYRHRPEENDGEYLRALVSSCQSACRALPSLGVVRRQMTRASEGLAVQVLNHVPDPAARDAALVTWVRERNGDHCDWLAWFEQTAAASSTLGIYALMASAADPALTSADAARVDAAYHPWTCLLCTLMDSVVDTREDQTSGHHSYVSHYADLGVAIDRICEVLRCALKDLESLPNGARHCIIATGMVSMYLSKDVGDPDLRDALSKIRREAGWVTRIEIDVSRILRARGPLKCAIALP